MDWREHITVNPAVLHGKACIRGTRIPVAVVLANPPGGAGVVAKPGWLRGAASNVLCAANRTHADDAICVLPSAGTAEAEPSGRQ
jgi:hypothetical protein